MLFSRFICVSYYKESLEDAQGLAGSHISALAHLQINEMVMVYVLCLLVLGYGRKWYNSIPVATVTFNDSAFP